MYQVAAFQVSSRMEPHEVPLAKMSEVVERIVRLEGPIHGEEVGRRVAALFGKERAGARIAAAALKALWFVRQRGASVIEDGGFWMTDEQRADCPVRNRFEAPITVQRAEMIAPVEIQAAIRQALTENGGIEESDAAVAVARLLGFQRTGQELRARIDRQIANMIQAGALRAESGIIRLV
jgi:hypothetical protein